MLPTAVRRLRCTGPNAPWATRSLPPYRPPLRRRRVLSRGRCVPLHLPAAARGEIRVWVDARPERALAVGTREESPDRWTTFDLPPGERPTEALPGLLARSRSMTEDPSPCGGSDVTGFEALSTRPKCSRDDRFPGPARLPLHCMAAPDCAESGSTIAQEHRFRIVRSNVLEAAHRQSPLDNARSDGWHPRFGVHLRDCQLVSSCDAEVSEERV